MALTDEELAAMRARAAAATLDPWSLELSDGGELLLVVANLEHVAKTHQRDDAAFIAHAREDVPRLLAEVERRQRVERELLRIIGEAAKASPETAEALIALASIAVESE